MRADTGHIGPPGRTPPTLLGRFTIVSAIFTVTFALALGWIVQRAVTSAALDEAVASTAQIAEGLLAPYLVKDDFARPITPERLNALDRLIGRHLGERGIVRVKVWNRESMVIYSSDRTLVGKRYPPSDELNEALSGRVAAEVSPLADPEDASERALGPLIEVYVPLRLPGTTRPDGAYEIYRDARPLLARIQTDRTRTWLLVTVGTAMLYAALFGLVRRASAELLDKQEASRASEEHYRSLFDGVPVGLYRSTPGGQMLSANPAMVQMLGYPDRETLLARSGLDLYVNPSEREQWHTLLDQSEIVRDYEMQMRRYDGAVIWTKKTARAVHDARGHVLYYEGALEDVTERKRLEAQLIHLANHDPLTGLLNRRRFQEELEHRLAQARRYGTQGAVLFLDLDDFKDINDRFGHRIGDEFLATLAGKMRRRLRETDILARMGGDEFAVLLPHAEVEAKAVAQDLLETVRHHTVVVDKQALCVTGSVGIALFLQHGTLTDEVLAHADLAMYKAREEGRNRFSVYAHDEDWQASLESRMAWSSRIRDALEHDGFVLYGQPILNLQSNHISQYELLLRMAEGGDKVILPGAFLDSAERFGLIDDIDRWVVHQAIQMIAQHRRMGRDLVLEVNLSTKAVANGLLLALVERELRETGIDPACLIFEITEGAAIADIPQAQQFIATLKGLGCRFALDDFGVGFFSFYHLKNLPVDYLKIDGTFVQNLAHDQVDQHLVQAMVQMARILGKKTVAEFANSEETVGLLRAYGVDYAQGHYIGRPRPVGEIANVEDGWSAADEPVPIPGAEHTRPRRSA